MLWLAGLYTECKYGGPLGRPGTSSVKARLVSPLLFCFDNAFSFSRVYFTMPSYCCVPNCNQKEYTSLSGEKVSFFNFPKSVLTRKQWIHAIRDEGNDFVITERTKVCSLHFRPEDLRKSLNGRVYVREDAIPSKFDWSGPSPKKRKAPTERKPLLTKKKLLNDDCFETEEIFSMEAIETQPSTSTDKASEEPTAAEIIITQQQFYTKKP